MATLLDLLTEVRDLLADDSDTKYPRLQKVRWINRGQAAMFPKVHRVVRDSSTALVLDTFEYGIPTVLNGGKILGVECETDVASGRFIQLDGRQFDFVPGGAGQGILVLKGAILPSTVGSGIRITGAMPLETLVLDGDVYGGPTYTEQCPVYYAMALAMARDLEARMHYYRMSTTQALNGTVTEDFMTSSQFWMGQFHSLLEQVQMPLATP